MKAIAYIRVSTDEQDISPDFQRDEIIQYCIKHNLSYEIFEDIGISGAKEINERPGLNAAIDALKKGDLFIVHKLDRLVRGLFLQLTIEQLIIRKKGTLLSLTGEGTDGEATPEKKLLKNMSSVFAEFERDQIKRRTKNALSQLKKNGKVYGGKMPYGYKRQTNPENLINKDKKVPDFLVIDEGEQKVIQQILDLRYKHRCSYHTIVKHLNNEGIQTRTGKPWQFKQVYNIVQNATKKLAA